MNSTNPINEIISTLWEGTLGSALKELENAVLTGQLKVDYEKLTALRDEFDLLTDFWQRGYKDPQRQTLYGRMRQSLYVLVANAEQRYRLQGSPYLKNLYQRPRQAARNWSVVMVRKQLEDFVTNGAMLELEPNHVRAAKEKQLYKDHQQWMSDLFDYIVTSMQWHESLADAFIEMLLSPTIDLRDQQLIVSSIMLATMSVFDAEKMRVLISVYRQAQDEALRQRALVGWVLTINCERKILFPQIRQLIVELCEDERCRDELTELQMQLFYCLTVDADGEKIQHEIMPDLIKGSHMKMTRLGLQEIEEDQLEEILHPEKTEQDMERMEQRMQQMADMQKRGADIYFGGFKQMKHFPFFQTLSNWFVPFYSKHPDISDILERTKQQRFLKIITSVGAFCDSDKYSFTLIYEKVLEYLPASVREMIEKGEASPRPLGGEIALEEQQTPAFIRRSYLQNLYRFFRLFSVRTEFPKVFDDTAGLLFFADKLFVGTQLLQRFNEVVTFLLKRDYKDEAMDMLNSVPAESQNYQYFMLYARAGRDSEYAAFDPIDCYQEALALKPGDRKALRGYARELFSMERYEEAVGAYDELLRDEPDNHALLLGKAAAQAGNGDCEDALKILYQLNYEQPDDAGVKRVLAWTLAENRQFSQAEKLYLQLVQQEQPQAEDFLNYGYSLWLEGRVKEAIDVFLRYLKQFDVDPADLWFELNKEHDRLSRHGIGDVDFQLMCDAVSNSSF